ncbi:4065_t:CDS:1 [Funneliformis mosseae]|uniref:4065_t:CDS:1 n=1 Tax=Funneliformis mosseae TaxID=27381 RepID=A0A9N9G306_FUNMO|nr:4065_t:CDS:1 [Funneliformis mosseae]
MFTKFIHFLTFMVCVPAAIATYVEVAGTMSSFVTEIGFSNLNGDVCFRADTGYNNCLNFSGEDAEGRSFCSSDGIWCFTLDSFDRIAGSTTYSIMFANRESTLQSSVDNKPNCDFEVNICKWTIPNHGFDM